MTRRFASRNPTPTAPAASGWHPRTPAAARRPRARDAEGVAHSVRTSPRRRSWHRRDREGHRYRAQAFDALLLIDGVAPHQHERQLVQELGERPGLRREATQSPRIESAQVLLRQLRQQHLAAGGGVRGKKSARENVGANALIRLEAGDESHGRVLQHHEVHGLAHPQAQFTQVGFAHLAQVDAAGVRDAQFDQCRSDAVCARDAILGHEPAVLERTEVPVSRRGRDAQLTRGIRYRRSGRSRSSSRRFSA